MVISIRGEGVRLGLRDIERYSALHADFVKKMAVVLLERHESGTAVRLLNKLLGRNELDEETVRLLLGAYASQKDKASFIEPGIEQWSVTGISRSVHPPSSRDGERLRNMMRFQ